MTAEPHRSQRLLVALLNRASTDHRLSILNYLSNASSPFELVTERSLHLTLPEDDVLLRSLLASDIVAHGEAETLVKWALNFTASTSLFCVFKLRNDNSAEDISELFSKEHASKLWERYGQDEIYFSPDRGTAEMQVQLLFPDGEGDVHTPASTEADLPELAPAYDAPLMTINTSVSSQGQSTASQASTSTAATSVRPQSRASLHPTPKAAQNNVFKARPIPSTVKSKPSIEPRMSKAAALRMGIQLPTPQKPSGITAGPPNQGANVGVPGSIKRAAAPPLSLKAPSIAPRLNKAALARQGGTAEPRPGPRRPASVAGYASASTSRSASGSNDTAPERQRKPVDFSATPGHKRSSFAGASIASIAPPTIAPRLNKAALARQTGSVPAQPVEASAHKPVDYSSTPGHKRLSLTAPRAIASIGPPTIAPRQNRASMSRIQTQHAAPSPRGPPPSAFKGAPRSATDFSAVPGHKRASLSLSIPSLAAPSLAPRQNRASLARTRPSLTPATHPTSKSESNEASGKENTPQPRSAAETPATPGNKRHALNISLACLRAPAIAPRLNKAAGARIGLGRTPTKGSM